MSALTKCNRCSLASMQARAAQHGDTLTLATGTDGWVRVHSATNGHIASFAALPDTCACTPEARYS